MSSARQRATTLPSGASSESGCVIHDPRGRAINADGVQPTLDLNELLLVLSGLTAQVFGNHQCLAHARCRRGR